MATRAEVITRALRRLRVVAMDEAATTDQETETGEVLDALAEELRESWGIYLPDLTDVDSTAYLPLADALAAHMAGDFGVAPPVPFSRAVVRLRAVTNPDDRDDDYTPPVDYY